MTTKEHSREALAFYKEALAELKETGVDFMLGGAFAVFRYTGIFRDTKDLDIFCRSADYPKILKHFEKKGYRIELHDARWIAKVFKDDYFIDIIFDSVNHTCIVDDVWLQYATEGTFADESVKFISAEDLLWCKTYVQNRERFDGADVNHVILRYGKEINWERLLKRLDQHWQLLLAELIIFQFVYPSEYRNIIPQWLFDELLNRAKEQFELPPAVVRVCRGPLIDNTQYAVDIKEWNYKSTTIITV